MLRIKKFLLTYINIINKDTDLNINLSINKKDKNHILN
jgi:hypothetical protein